MGVPVQLFGRLQSPLRGSRTRTDSMHIMCSICRAQLALILLRL